MSSFPGLGRLALLSLAANALAAPTEHSIEKRATTISFNVGAGASAAQTIPADAHSLSIEFCYIADYIGDVGKPNMLTKNLLQNLQDRAGVPPTIRVGGNTQDNSYYCETCSQTLVNGFNGGTEAVNTTYNKNLFVAMNQNVPSRQKYIFGLNLKRNNLDAAKAAAVGALKYLDRFRLSLFELGNESDFYGSTWRPGGWNIQIYSAQIIQWIKSINAAGASAVGWQLGALALDMGYSGFAGKNIVNGGVPEAIGNARQLSDHTYPFSQCDATRAAQISLPSLMNHTRNVEYFYGPNAPNFSFDADIKAAKAKGMKMVMGETGSVSCHGKKGVSNTLGAALWEIDYVLNGVNMGMSGVYFHMGANAFFYSAWQPVTYGGIPPTVWPTYYGMLFVADLIQGVSSPKIYEVKTLSTAQQAVYAVYSNGKVVRLAILNLAYFTGFRGGVTYDVSTILGKNIKVRRLTGPASNAEYGVTLAGQSFASGKATGNLNVENVTNGQVTVNASEAVLIQL